MSYGRDGISFLVLVGCVMASSLAWSQEVEVTASTALQTTYVFRGNPQYFTDENPSFQLGAEVGVLHGPGRWWGHLWGATALAERKANGRLGSADELTLAGGYTWDFHPRASWSFGGIAYLRPENDPIDLREEAMTRLTWQVAWADIWSLTAYTAAYGEVHRLLGVYAEVGAVNRLELGDGFTLTADVHAGGSRYVEGDERFNHISGTIALNYDVALLKGLSVSGQLSPVLTQNFLARSGSDFTERHGLVWSGLFISYTPMQSNDPVKGRLRFLAPGFQAVR